MFLYPFFLAYSVYINQPYIYLFPRLDVSDATSPSLQLPPTARSTFVITKRVSIKEKKKERVTTNYSETSELATFPYIIPGKCPLDLGPVVPSSFANCK
jgi:hypothetical protein